MSKITRALEKAARERQQRLELEQTLQARQDPQGAAAALQAAPIAPAPVLPARRPLPATPPAATPSWSLASAPDHAVDPHVIAYFDAASPIVEQYRILRTNIHTHVKRSGPMVLLVTSAIRGEGKSITAINLALTLAQQEGKRVCLVDADMRKGSIAQWLGLQNEQGLSTVLVDGHQVQDLLMGIGSPHGPLAVLCAGPAPKQPAELLDSAKMRDCLRTLRAQFDYVIVDAPPVLPVADAGILGPVTDGVLFVIQTGSTQRKTVQEAVTRLQQMQAKVVGCVLTRMEYYVPGYYRYYHYEREQQKQADETNGKTAAIPAVHASPSPVSQGPATPEAATRGAGHESARAV